MIDDILEHYGVPGMRWGVRKSRQSTDSKYAKSLRGRKLSSLSNKELESLNKRMQLEQNYKRLKSGDKSAARKFVEKQLSESASKLIQNVLTSAVKVAMKTVMNHRNSNNSNVVDGKLLED